MKKLDIEFDFIYQRIREVDRRTIQQQLGLDDATYEQLEKAHAAEITRGQALYRRAEGTGHEFMTRTQYLYLPPSEQSLGKTQPPLQRPCDPTARRIKLPKPDELDIASVDLRTAIEERRSVRKYVGQPLSLDELAFALWTTQGVREARPGRANAYSLRTVPSAGARHAFETYVLLNQANDLTLGLYRYLALGHELVEINPDPTLVDRIMQACGDQRMVKTAAAVFIWVADVQRMTYRYGERGYRYLHLDAGHVCQNLYLAAAAIDCGVCAIAAFFDDHLNDVLGLDGKEQFVIYLATIGKLTT